MGQLEDMALFVRIVEAGGIGKASQQMNLAKSAVSRRLSELERRLHVQLINRNTRKWSVTEQGQMYFEKARSVLEEVSSLNAQITGNEGELEGKIRLSIPMSFGLKMLAPVINAFSQQHPQVTFELDLSDRQVDLVDEGYDLALRIADLEDSSLRARHLAIIRHMLIASPQYIERHGHPKSVEDLAGHRFLKYSLTRASTLHLTSPDGTPHPLHVNPLIRANNADLLLELAVEGRGISYLPTFLVHEQVVNGALVPVLLDHVLPHLNAYLIYPNSRFVASRTRAFIDFIVDHCGDNPYWDRQLEETSYVLPW